MNFNNSLFDFFNTSGTVGPANPIIPWSKLFPDLFSYDNFEKVAEGSLENAGDWLVNDDNLWSYLDGLITSAGAENAINRDYNSAEALANREFQASEAQKQRDWYTELSNSAYQRSVADLKAAGLNPILAAGSLSPAASSATSVPSGSSGSYQVGAGDTITSIVNSLANVMSASGNLLTGLGNNKKGRAALVSSILSVVGKAIAAGG